MWLAVCCVSYDVLSLPSWLFMLGELDGSCVRACVCFNKSTFNKNL